MKDACCRHNKSEDSKNDIDGKKGNTVKIRLSIQEIIADFEHLVRYDERLDAMFDFEKAGDGDIEGFFNDMVRLAEKYLPTYEEKISEEYFSDDLSCYDGALMLYNILYENFREIFYQLV